MKLFGSLLLLFFSLVSFQVYALGNAEELVSQCTVVPTEPEQAYARVRCEGYVGGILDAYSLVKEVYTGIQLYCAPQKGIMADDAVSAVIDFLKQFPSKTDIPASSAVLLALRNKYPCGQ